MAAKDTAPYITACLDSIIAQSYPNWELIAINDHSEDRTPQILEDYATKDLPKLKIYKIKSKEGLVERANNDAETISFFIVILLS